MSEMPEEIYAVMNTHGIVNTVDEGYPYCKPTKFIHEDKYNTLKAENEKLREAKKKTKEDEWCLECSNTGFRMVDNTEGECCDCEKYMEEQTK